MMGQSEQTGVRGDVRRMWAQLLITLTIALSFGHTLRMPTLLEANDISRWCTVWSLVERGTYVIDECPWHTRTQDKVFRAVPGVGDGEEKHFYSSKPPLLPTLIAGMVYPARMITGVPLETLILQERSIRPDQPDVVPKPVEWPVYIYYFKPVVVLLNVVPMLVFLICYAKYLNRIVKNDWAYLSALLAAALCTQLIVFNAALNNHTVAAYAGFFAAYAFLRIWEFGPSSTSTEPKSEPGPAAFWVAGFFGAFCACNELPAAMFGLALFVCLAYRYPRRTFTHFVPAALIPCLAFLITQYAALGTPIPVYSEFGTPTYLYDNSYWLAPLEMDALDESKHIYLFHMLFGHHGVFSLTPIFLFSFVTIFRSLSGREPRLRLFSALVLAVSVAVIAFYTVKTNNYGGTTQGLRWLFWLFPLWLLLLPPAFEPGETRNGYRFVILLAVGFSALSIGYALRNPWGNPWITDFLEHTGVYPLKR